MPFLCRKYLGAPEALDIFVKVNVVDHLAIDVDRTGCSGASQDVSDTGSAITQSRIASALLFAFYKGLTKGAVVSLHFADPV